MIYITGDTHRDFSRIIQFCKEHNTTQDDIMVVLGDNGINYYGNDIDTWFKQSLSQLPITLFLIKGNHDLRPEKLPQYQSTTFCGGQAYVETEFPNLIFAKDGEVYDLNGKSALVIGGAYSIDKDYRLVNGLRWFPDEQPTPEIKASVECLVTHRKHFDFILTHTCPLSFVLDNAIVDRLYPDSDTSTEEWMDWVREQITYGRWYCGHWHRDKDCGNVRFMYYDIEPLHRKDEQHDSDRKL